MSLNKSPPPLNNDEMPAKSVRLGVQITGRDGLRLYLKAPIDWAVVRSRINEVRAKAKAPAKRRSRAQPVTIPKVKRARKLAEAAGIDPKKLTFNKDGSFTFEAAEQEPVATPADTAAPWDDL